jgi:hypothetical protein
MASLKYHLKGSLKGTSGGISYVFLLCFTVLLKQLRRLYIGGFKYRQCLITAPVILTCIYALVHQVRIYTFGVPTTIFGTPTTHLRG